MALSQQDQSQIRDILHNTGLLKDADFQAIMKQAEAKPAATTEALHLGGFCKILCQLGGEACKIACGRIPDGPAKQACLSACDVGEQFCEQKCK